MSLPSATALICVLLLYGVDPSTAQSQRPMEVTSDSAAYCEHLAGRVMELRQRMPRPQPEVDLLLDRGQQLCAEGRVRPGLNRLRHALLDLREARNGPGGGGDGSGPPLGHRH